jgi:predicted phage terminase large subunit-like protein
LARPPFPKPARQAAAEYADVEKGVQNLLRQKKTHAATQNLLDYIQFTMPDPEDINDVTKSAYVVGRPHKAICDGVQKFVEGGFPGYSILILEAPPRHGKSEIVSKRLPAWYAGKFPRQNIVVGTYNDEFANDIGADVRRVIHSPQHKAVFPGHQLIRGGTAKDRLQTTQGGLTVFVGRGGALTGRGAHLLILDDLIKGSEEARSKAIRDQIWDWFVKVAMTRRMGRKLVIIMFTRWHEDDLIGRLTNPENEFYKLEIAQKIKVITLPAIAEEGDDLGREPGEALWPDGPDTFNEAFLQEQRALDPVAFNALYQQRPTVEDGILFRRETIEAGFYRPDELPGELRYYCASDHAVSTAQRADLTCMGKVGVDQNGHIWLLDEIFWKKARSEEAVEAMLAMGGGARAPLIWWAEKGHISKSIGPFLHRRMAETGHYFNMVEVTPIGDKEQRAQAISARVAMGHVHFPAAASWLMKAVDQMLGFPNGQHDDFVDFMSLLGLGLRTLVSASAPVVRKAEPKYGSFAWLRAQQRRGEQRETGRNGGF